MDAMNIGQAAKASGVSVKMVRHCEAVGLVPPRTDAGHRQYGASEAHTLRFIRQARSPERAPARAAPGGAAAKRWPGR